MIDISLVALFYGKLSVYAAKGDEDGTIDALNSLAMESSALIEQLKKIRSVRALVPNYRPIDNNGGSQR